MYRNSLLVQKHSKSTPKALQKHSKSTPKARQTHCKRTGYRVAVAVLNAHIGVAAALIVADGSAEQRAALEQQRHLLPEHAVADAGLDIRLRKPQRLRRAAGEVLQRLLRQDVSCCASKASKLSTP